MTNLIDKESFSKAFYDEMSLGTSSNIPAFRQELTQTGSAPVSATLLENPAVQTSLLKARKPGIPSNYPAKGDYSIYFNPPEMDAGGATIKMQGGRGSIFVPAYPAAVQFQQNFQSNKPSAPEISLAVGDTPNLRNRINLAAGLWLISFNLTMAFRPLNPTSNAPQLLAGGMHALVHLLFGIKTSSGAQRYSQLFPQRVARESLLTNTSTPIAGSFVLQMDTAGSIDLIVRRSPTIGYYGTDPTNVETLALVKIAPTEAVQDPTEDIGNFVRLTRLA